MRCATTYCSSHHNIPLLVDRILELDQAPIPRNNLCLTAGEIKLCFQHGVRPKSSGDYAFEGGACQEHNFLIVNENYRSCFLSLVGWGVAESPVLTASLGRRC